MYCPLDRELLENIVIVKIEIFNVIGIILKMSIPSDWSTIIIPLPWKPMNIDKAKEILDMFGWHNFKKIEIIYTKLQMYCAKHVDHLYINKQTDYKVTLNNDRKPLPEDLNYKIMDNGIENVVFKLYFEEEKDIELNITYHVLTLNGNFSITEEQIKEKIGFPVRIFYKKGEHIREN